MTAFLASSTPKLSDSVQVQRFIIVGAGTVSVDYAILYLMTSQMHVNYLISTGVSFTLASTLNYLLSIRYVFESGKLSRVFEFSFFVTTTLVGLGINQVLMWLFVSVFGLYYLFAKTICFGIVTVWNFVSKKKLVFKN